MDDVQRAAEAIAKAKALLVTAGAGMGVDSGLPDFRGDEGFWKAYPPFRELGLRFVDLASPGWFEDDPELAWGFYGHRLELYRRTVPHRGFEVLRRLARAGGPLLRLHLERRRPVPARRASPRTDRRVPRLDPPPAVHGRLRHRHLAGRRHGERSTPRPSARARRSPAARGAARSPGPTSSCSGTGAGTTRAAGSRSDVSRGSWTRRPREHASSSAVRGTRSRPSGTPPKAQPPAWAARWCASTFASPTRRPGTSACAMGGARGAHAGSTRSWKPDGSWRSGRPEGYRASSLRSWS